MSLKDPTPHKVTVVMALLSGPPELNVPRIKQLGDEWCWAASAQMVLAFYQYPVPTPQQCEMANLLFSLSDCCDTPLPLPGSDCDQPCFGADVEWIYNQYGWSATWLNGVADPGQLGTEITQGRPVEVRMVTDTQSGHVVLVKWAGTEAGQPSVHINDPLKSTTSVMTYAELLAKGAFDSWIGIG